MANLTRYELPSDRADNQALSRILRETRAGRLNVISEITLANGATSTVIKDSAIGPTTVPIVVPTSSAQAALNWWLVSRDKGQLTLGHTAPTGAQTLLLVLIG